jgi:3-methyladenine DNA glycosylase AlkD
MTASPAAVELHGPGAPSRSAGQSPGTRPSQVRSTSSAERDSSAARRARAARLGASLADELSDPAAFAARLRDALAELAEAEYRAGQAFAAPGIGPTHGVRTPIQVALRRAFEKAARRASPTELLFVAERLLAEPEREARWFAIATLERVVVREPERAWQLLRRAAADADDWVTVDTLARPYGRGILAEAYRWAELEQLTVSPSRWERRLVGSTIATLPFVDRRAGRETAVAASSLSVLASLIGDAEPDVQKALSWAYRSMTIVDQPATTAALEYEAEIAASRDDGHRAWVIRDSLSKLDPRRAEAIRGRLAGIRRRAGAPSTSEAAALAERFGDMGLGRRMPQPPLA